MYYVLNELGQVVPWCFMENEKSDSVKPYITDLSKRLGKFVCFLDQQLLQGPRMAERGVWEPCGSHAMCQDTFHLIQRI